MNIEDWIMVGIILVGLVATSTFPITIYQGQQLNIEAVKAGCNVYETKDDFKIICDKSIEVEVNETK